MSDAAAVAPSVRYDTGVRAGQWQDDAAQRALLPQLDRMWQALLAPPLRAGLLARLRGKAPEPQRGLYLWGRVGRGKTFLMDLLYASLPAGVAERWHFHRFMGMVQARLRALDGHADPLRLLGREIGARVRALCLDEFIVADIGDAMILSELLQGLEAAGVMLITTGNTPPEQLYRDGLQRARFLPAIAWLQRHCAVVAMDSPHDWRLRALKQAPTWLTPLSAASERQLARLFDSLAHGADAQQGSCIEVLERPIALKRAAGQVIWFDFDALCGDTRAVADYIEIGRSHAHVLISAVPQFDPDHEDSALRFVQLVDEFYDRRVKLVCSAAAPIVEIYQGKRLRAAFARTQSRLIEMQSEDYLACEHRG